MSAKPEVELIFTIAPLEKLMSTVTDTTMESMEVEYGLPIGTITFDLGWPWTVLDLGYRTCTSNISNAVRDTMLDTMEVS